MSTLGKYKKSITDDFFVAYVMGDSSKQFDLWLNDDFDPNDIDSFGETLIMNVLYTYGSNTLKISEADFKESVGLIIGHEKYDPNVPVDQEIVFSVLQSVFLLFREETHPFYKLDLAILDSD